MGDTWIPSLALDARRGFTGPRVHRTCASGRPLANDPKMTEFIGTADNVVLDRYLDAALAAPPVLVEDPDLHRMIDA